ncbi:MAG: D-alanyl-D-alanine carboxypeptidase [Patescibacteria group bacterium]|nr:D-alanyl-D-alanine carboxypeptidase [Patescibacteria group bacterium]
MPFRTHFGMLFFTALFLFYPGQTPLWDYLSHRPELLTAQAESVVPEIKPIPLKPKTGPSITAEGAYVVDYESFTPLFARNKDTRFLPASTTKIITALVAEELFETDEIIKVNKVYNEGQVMGLIQGERITVENLLYGILVHSGNDAAYALADAYGYERFISRMNAKAADLGMSNSHFRNPHGLDESGQYSSPFDLAIAGRAVLHNKELRKMVHTKEITISDEDFRVFHRLSNVNQLLGEIQGVGGLKTGYTEAAGQNLVSFYRRPDGKQFIIVVLKSQDRFQDTREIISWLQGVRYFSVSP